jgi:carboxypeptidase T
MGGHHAREHISVEMPLMLAQNLVRRYRAGDARIVRMIESREISIIPAVNPDGLEFDIAGDRYKMWRKNRRHNGGSSYGVDLNRNYGFMWGTGGSSSSPNSDTYKGPQPFSEPETRAIRDFVLARNNLTTLLSFHTFSELILYPWGHKYEKIEDEKSFNVHRTMAQQMARWNGYQPQQSSELYIASGDTVDWSFGERGLVSFTFELDPKSIWDGGFYPGQDRIDVVFQKNWEPCLYLIENANNPYQVTTPTHQRFGLQSALVQ